MDQRRDEHERRATTEALFRDVNERIAESARRFGAERTDFVCECSDPNCTERVEASLGEYERIRGDGATFLLAPGHEHGDIERVVDRRSHFSVVEKVHARVRRTVKRLNPRSRPATT